MDFPPLTLESQLADAHLYYEKKAEHLRDLIDKRDFEAREAYQSTQAGLHNLHTKGWYELTEAERDAWRSKFGIKR